MLKTDYEDVYIDGKLTDVIDQLHQYIERYGEDAELDITTEYDSAVARIRYQREEFESERRQREEDEKRWKEIRRQQLEALKKEFGEV